MSNDSTPPRGGPSRRAELKRAYKEAPPPMGVYAIRCLQNGRQLVGASRNLPAALNRARFELSMKTMGRRCPALQADWDRLGAASFAFETLDVLKPTEEPQADPREELEVLLALWLDRLKPFGDAGYNDGVANDII